MGLMLGAYEENNSFSTIFSGQRSINHIFVPFGALWQLNTDWLTSLGSVTSLCRDDVIEAVSESLRECNHVGC